MLSELKRSGQGQNITFTVGQSFKRGIIFCYLKWKREHKDLEIEQLTSADTADKILSSDWIVSLNLCSDWLVNLIKKEFQKWRQANKHTDKLILELVELLTFAVKKHQKNYYVRNEYRSRISHSVWYLIFIIPMNAYLPWYSNRTRRPRTVGRWSLVPLAAMAWQGLVEEVGSVRFLKMDHGSLYRLIYIPGSSSNTASRRPSSMLASVSVPSDWISTSLAS